MGRDARAAIVRVAAIALLCCGPFLAPPARAAVFRSTYSGSAFFNTGATRYGKANGVDYAFEAVFTYDTAKGSVAATSLGETFTGPLQVALTLGGTTFALGGSGASSVSRVETLPTTMFPYYQNFASDQVFTGPSPFSGDFVAAGVSFIAPSPIAFIPPFVTTPFSASAGPLTLDNIGSFSFDNGSTTGMLGSASLLVTQIPLPASAPLFAAALAGLGTIGCRAGRTRRRRLVGRERPHPLKRVVS